MLDGDPNRKFIRTFHATEKYIDKKELSSEEFLNSIKTIQYKKKLENKKEVFFDISWQELKNKKNAAYVANVIDKKDFIYTITFFNIKGDKLYKVPFSSFNPVKKAGTMLIYSNNKVSQERIYSNDSLRKVSEFDSNEKLKLEFENITYKDKSNNSKQKKSYTTIINKAGNNVVDSLKPTIVNYGGKDVFYEMLDKKISNTYYEEEDHKVFFYTSKVKSISLTRFKTDLELYLYSKYSFRKARLKNNIEGTILLNIKTDYKGRIIHYSIVNTLGNEMDQIIEKFCQNKLSEKANYRFRFKEIKLEDKEDQCEFLIPITFEHKRFYRSFTKPSYNHDLFFQQQFFHQQQQFNQPIRVGF